MSQLEISNGLYESYSEKLCSGFVVHKLGESALCAFIDSTLSDDVEPVIRYERLKDRDFGDMTVCRLQFVTEMEGVAVRSDGTINRQLWYAAYYEFIDERIANLDNPENLEKLGRIFSSTWLPQMIE